jgi:short-subunit dehydrogenase
MIGPDTTIVITGASQGIGRALSIYFGTQGARIIAIARNDAGLRETQRLTQEAGGKCDVVAMDLSDAPSIETAIGQMGKGPVDILINNAADVTSKPLMDTTLDEIDHLVRTNVTGTLQLTRLVVPLMRNRPDAAIINMSSLAGYKPNPTQTVYSITKTAVNGMSDALRSELSSQGIQVINVALSSVNVEGGQNPGGVPIDIVARKIEEAVRRGRDEVYLSSVSKWLMRLYKFFPALAKRR